MVPLRLEQTLDPTLRGWADRFGRANLEMHHSRTVFGLHHVALSVNDTGRIRAQIYESPLTWRKGRQSGLYDPYWITLRRRLLNQRPL